MGSNKQFFARAISKILSEYKTDFGLVISHYGSTEKPT